MDVRRTAAVNAARLSAIASRALGRGGGTALPGLVATRLDPDIVAELAAQIPFGSVVVSGTNGKTTTSRILDTILRRAGYEPLRNQSGSNLARGLASSLIRETTIAGNISAQERSIGLFEVDEAALPGLLSEVRPVALLLLDLFRDQLDRYGEVATVARLWTGAVDRLPATARLVANADDPLIADVAAAARGEPIFFGLGSWDRETGQTEHASDVKACPRCGGAIAYTASTFGHLGHYSCTACDFARPVPRVSARDVTLHGVTGSAFILALPGAELPVTFPLPGLYNVYNAIGAAATAWSLGVTAQDIAHGLAHATPAFGRMERLDIKGRRVYLALAKNPAGLNEVIRTVAQGDQDLHLLVMLNDNTADGHDVSWIWDADVELLAGRVASVTFAGRRAEDMALRFKYAGVTQLQGSPSWSIEHDTERAFHASLAATPEDATLFVVPTYTAMLDVRDALARLGYVKPYWEE